MDKKTRFSAMLLGLTALLAILTFQAGLLLKRGHSSMADFVNIVCFPFFTLVFILLLFVLPVSRISARKVIRNMIRGMRITVMLALVVIAIAVFWPRSYGTPLPTPRPGTQYWDLPTGSHIAYTLVPAKGPKKPYPIIYLQGGPGGTIDNNLIRGLTPIADDGYDIYLYDQIGSGYSDRLDNIREYTADRHKSDLQEIVQKIGAEKVVLIGQSWGAILAVLYAADNPGHVDRLIFTGPGPIQPAHPDVVKLPAPDSLHLRKPYYSNRDGNERVSNIRTRAMEMVALRFGKKLASDQEADDFGAYLNRNVNWSTVCDTAKIQTMQQQGPRGSGSAGYYVQVMTVQSFRRLADPRPALKNTPIPILIIKGQCDNQPWGVTHEYMDLFPNHQLVVVPNAGHGVLFDQPASYLLAVRNFLKKTNGDREHE